MTNNLLNFQNRKEFNSFYKQTYVGMFKYEDGTHSVLSDNDKLPKEGDIFRDYNGRLKKITKIFEVRDHKGIFTSEKNRPKISIVSCDDINYYIDDENKEESKEK